jgi:hypothetical protein
MRPTCLAIPEHQPSIYNTSSDISPNYTHFRQLPIQQIKMLFSKLAFLSSLAAFAVAQDATTEINLTNIPAECTDVCTQVAAIVNGCDTDNSKLYNSHAELYDQKLTTTPDNDDNARLQCICTANNANSLIPNCQSCITQYSDNDDTNVASLAGSCSFTTTAVGPSSTGVVGGVGGVGGGATAAQTTSVDTVTSVVSQTSVAIIISSTGSMSMSMSGSGAASQTTNAAPAKTAGAAMGAGALVFAMGML